MRLTWVVTTELYMHTTEKPEEHGVGNREGQSDNSWNNENTQCPMQLDETPVDFPTIPFRPLRNMLVSLKHIFKLVLGITFPKSSLLHLDIFVFFWKTYCNSAE